VVPTAVPCCDPVGDYWTLSAFLGESTAA